jgi:uncharacterized repeat protein (TIGR03803 family)
MYSRRQQKPNMGACGSGASHMNAKRRREGEFPRGRLGALLGAALVAVAGFSSTDATQELTTLYSFTGGGSGDGANPSAGLMADPAGNLYGTTAEGGASGRGTVFQLDPSGNLTVLHSFTGGDGSHPRAALIADAAGNLYGTTISGGVQDAGTVFQLTPPGTLNVLYSFTGSGDGALPWAGMIADASGNLYGTTYGGGANGQGTVFQLDPSGTLTVLYSFTGGNDASPWAGLIADAAGNLYGTTEGGDGPGEVFQLTPSGTPNVLHNFTGRDGAIPHGGLIFDAPGNLYGTTHNGGTSGYGTVFQLTPAGTLNVLHSFTGGSDGAYPEAGLIADTAGNLYGTTWGGGAGGQGTVFQLTPSGTLNILHRLHRQRRDISQRRPDRRRGGQSLRHDRPRRRQYELPWGLRHSVRADGASEFYRGPSEAKHEHESAPSRSASDGPPVTAYRSSNTKSKAGRTSHRACLGFARESMTGGERN